jgi:signal transduction histidine kinase
MPQPANTRSSTPTRGWLHTRFHLPRTTVRWRLTLVYGALFLASGATLLAITYVLVAHATLVPIKPQPQHFNFVKAPAPIRAALRSTGGQIVIKRVVERQRISDLHELVIESGIALGIMALLSAFLGWVIAGRVLAPLRTITATTREISESNLHERLQISGPPDELRQLADTIDQLLSETLLARMIENVIENAVRHNQQRGRIDIACELDGGQARLLIENTGPALDEHAVAQLAQPFRRLAPQRTGSENGHGLGLSIVAAIAAAHGGNLRRHARPQGGLQVTITLPDATVTQTAPVPA